MKVIDGQDIELRERNKRIKELNEELPYLFRDIVIGLNPLYQGEVYSGKTYEKNVINEATAERLTELDFIAMFDGTDFMSRLNRKLVSLDYQKNFTSRENEDFFRSIALDILYAVVPGNNTPLGLILSCEGIQPNSGRYHDLVVLRHSHSPHREFETSFKLFDKKALDVARLELEKFELKHNDLEVKLHTMYD